MKEEIIMRNLHFKVISCISVIRDDLYGDMLKIVLDDNEETELTIYTGHTGTTIDVNGRPVEHLNQGDIFKAVKKVMKGE